MFAVAIRAPSCQDCSKAGAAEVEVMQHTLAESNYLNSPGEIVVLIAESRGANSVPSLRRIKTNKAKIGAVENTSTSERPKQTLPQVKKINMRKWGPRLTDKCLGRRVHSGP